MDTTHRLRARRLAAGLTQEHLSASAEISQQYLSELERTGSPPSDRVKVRLARALGIDPYELFPLDELVS